MTAQLLSVAMRSNFPSGGLTWQALVSIQRPHLGQQIGVTVDEGAVHPGDARDTADGGVTAVGRNVLEGIENALPAADRVGLPGGGQGDGVLRGRGGRTAHNDRPI
ncbi:hypothetical protein ACQPYA_16500 [Micromonospora sp. CA-263727]|uniref:hypothetical protein n=1 Tax=Micromonospora sp. CA-263727 TaxID=3239967 RepID=UPI003D93F3BE